MPTSHDTTTVPASEYDALIDLIHTAIPSRDHQEAIRRVVEGHGEAEGIWLWRILTGGERARELFPTKDPA